VTHHTVVREVLAVRVSFTNTPVAAGDPQRIVRAKVATATPPGAGRRGREWCGPAGRAAALASLFGLVHSTLTCTYRVWKRDSSREERVFGLFRMLFGHPGRGLFAGHQSATL
jgi:hypothetical protein